MHLFAGKNQLSSNEITFSSYEDVSPCKEGIAAKYFLPPGKICSKFKQQREDI